MSFQEQFGEGLKGAFKMALALMAGDAATFKQGYTADNAALAVAGVFDVDAEDVKVALKRGFVVEIETSANDEGSTFATVTTTLADGEVVTETFASYFDDGDSVTAGDAAVSYVTAMCEARDYSLEERLGAYGMEFQREQAEREGY